LNELKEKWVAQATALWMRARASTAGQRIAALPWWRRWPTRREWLWFAAALPVLFVVYVLLLIPFTPSISDIRKAKLEQPAQILSADGKLIGEFKRSNRQWVPLEQISPAVVKALVATEDHRFYEHHGMDFTRTVGSVIHTLGGNPQGGSTITQQLARNLYPTEIGRARNANRKLKEAITAFKIEALYTKDDDSRDLSEHRALSLQRLWHRDGGAHLFRQAGRQAHVLESATLVGMLKGNAYYNPVINPDRAIARRNTVLSQMVKRGELRTMSSSASRSAPCVWTSSARKSPTGMAPHFSQQLRKWLIAWADKHDYNIYTDGLVVRTTSIRACRPGPAGREAPDAYAAGRGQQLEPPGRLERRERAGAAAGARDGGLRKLASGRPSDIAKKRRSRSCWPTRPS
jgi:penicillin-binding protein 1A